MSAGRGKIKGSLILCNLFMKPREFLHAKNVVYSLDRFTVNISALNVLVYLLGQIVLPLPLFIGEKKIKIRGK